MGVSDKYQLIIYGTKHGEKQRNMVLEAVQNEVKGWEDALGLDDAQREKTRVWVGEDGGTHKVYVLLLINGDKRVVIEWRKPLLMETLQENVTIEERPKQPAEKVSEQVKQ